MLGRRSPHGDRAPAAPGAMGGSGAVLCRPLPVRAACRGRSGGTACAVPPPRRVRALLPGYNMSYCTRSGGRWRASRPWYARAACHIERSRPRRKLCSRRHSSVEPHTPHRGVARASHGLHRFLTELTVSRTCLRFLHLPSVPRLVAICCSRLCGPLNQIAGLARCAALWLAPRLPFSHTPPRCVSQIINMKTAVIAIALLGLFAGASALDFDACESRQNARRRAIPSLGTARPVPSAPSFPCMASDTAPPPCDSHDPLARCACAQSRPSTASRT